jgi:plasmid stabilization system protein ParE
VTAQLILRGRAERHIADVRDWYAEQSPGLDAEFGTALDEAFTAIADMPRIGQLSENGIRRFVLHRFPYIVWYIVHDEAHVVRVLAITHQRREPHEVARHVGE